MSSSSDYDKLCPLFNWNTKSNGVLFPFPVHCGETGYIDLDSADLSTVLGSFELPFKARLVTAVADATSDGQGWKAAAASTEPVLGIVYGTNPLATAGAGTSIGVITCDGAAATGSVKWNGTTTATTLTAGQEVGVYLKTAGSSATSANADGGARVVLWFAVTNAP
jgi:hypothetical protein